MTPRRRPRLEDVTRVSLTEIAVVLGVSPRKARKLVAKARWIADPQGSPPTYDARFLDVIRAMRGQPHRALEPAHADWLARYLQEGPPHA